MDNTRRNVRIIKLVPGTLVLRFHDAIAYGDERTFKIPAGREYINLDIRFVVSMFQITGTMALYNMGYFTFSKEDKEAIFKLARELSLYYGNDDSGSAAQFEQPGLIYTEKEVGEMLRFKRIAEINKIVAEGTKPMQDLLVEVAIKQGDNLSMDIVRILEEGLGVQLYEGDE